MFEGIIIWVALIIIYMGVHEAFMPKTRQNEHISPLKNVVRTEHYDFVIVVNSFQYFNTILQQPV